MLRFLLPVFFATASSMAAAQCTGTDLRGTLSPQATATLEARLDATPFAAGNHWLAEKDGHTVHLIGTVHIDDPRLEAPFERLRPILSAADRILLEVTPEEEAKLQTALKDDPSLLMLTETTLPEALPEDDWQALSDAAAARGLPAITIAKFRPWYLATLLSLPPCAMSQMMGGVAGMDGRIKTLAQDEGIEMRALEPFDTGFRAFADIPFDDQLALLMSSILPDGVSEDMFATLLAAYFEENHAASWEVTRVLSVEMAQLSPEEEAQVFDQMTEGLLAARNRSWIPVIEDAAADGGVTVAAFGAAHLSGKDGVLALLQDRGFTLTRQEF